MRYQDKTFTAERIIIDGNEYVDCTFVDCTICYSGGTMSVEHCKFDSTVQLSLSGAAEDTARFLRSFMSIGVTGQRAVASVLGINVPGVVEH